ncbi:MAG: aminomethyl-transferring glycine dehydrogenase subunit GcvPA [Candidatus Omnitrophota bacterium]
MPYILNTPKDIEQMLKVIGVSSVEELYQDIPSSIRLKGSLSLREGLSEFEVKKEIEALSRKNTPLSRFNSFLGAGCYDHYVPAAVEAILASSSFLTAYTPYQAECSQGSLEAIYEYQSFICDLTGMDVSNASLFDGASALAEAALMSLRITGRKKILIHGLHPEYRKTLDTYLLGLEFSVEEIPSGSDGFIDKKALEESLNDEVACFAFASPNFFGLIEDAQSFTPNLKSKGVLGVMVANPLSLAMLNPPALFGIDIVCGDGQALGGRLNFGGPAFGLLASKGQYLRHMPGRIIGKTHDKDGSPAYCLTLQTREQHIRRQKATSNICSNHSLNAIGAAIYLSLMGEKGLRSVSLMSFDNAQYLYQRLKEIRGIKLPYGRRFFNEFVWEVEEAASVMEKLRNKNIIAGYYLGNDFPEFKNRILSCCTETKSKDDIDNFIQELAEVLHG